MAFLSSEYEENHSYIRFNTVLFPDQGAYSLIQPSTNVTWAEAVLLCSARGEDLSDAYTFPRLLSSAFESGCEFWVGIIRREFVTWDTGNIDTTEIQCIGILAP